LDREANRLDLKGGERLSRISVFDKADQLLRRFDLQASYFEVPSNLQSGFTTTYKGAIAADYLLDPGYENHRLRLDAVQETGSDGLTKPATRFSYSDIPLPAKTSFNVDFWGFNNGKRNNTLIPAYQGPDLFGTYTTFTGADRTPDSLQMQAGILRKITYPTGGSTTYTFEPHTYGNLSDEDDQLITDYPSVRLRVDNTNPGNSIPGTDTIRLSASAPLEVHYEIEVRDLSGNPTN